MQAIHDLWQRLNQLDAWHALGWSLAVFLLVYFGLLLFRHHVIVVLQRLAKRTHNKLDDVLIDVISHVHAPFFFTVALYAAIQTITVPGIVEKAVLAAFLFALVSVGVKLAERVLIYILSQGSAKDHQTARTSAAITVMIRTVLWAVGLLLILSNLGINVNSLIAGLGIGGLAVSLALQNVLTDVFSSFSILLDKPFQEGDVIMVGEHVGTVKHIGLKTTRIELLYGEELSICNTELTNAKVHNLRRMERRRICYQLGVTYDTPQAKLKKIPDLMKKIVEQIDNVEFGRTHFKAFGDFSLLFEVVYFVGDREYASYVAVENAVNLATNEVFAKEGIEFAYPTQVVHVEKS